jgi:site-specific DNA recombinase
MFELYGSGQHPLSTLRVALKKEFGVSLAKGYLERLLKNPFYTGQFLWDQKLFRGTHALLVSHDLFEPVQAVFRGHNKPKYRTHDFPYSRLLTCASDNRNVTAEK